MRLSELHPRFFINRTSDHPIGITFECPCCLGSGQRLAVAIHMDGTNFDPDPDNPQQLPTDERVWSVVDGDSFENISLSPSIDASDAGHWHGYITNGEAR